jgi:YfiH family protein
MNGSEAAITFVITRFPVASPSPRARASDLVLESALLRNAGFVGGFGTRNATLGDVGLGAARVVTVTQVHGSSVIVARGGPDAVQVSPDERADAIVLTPGRAGAVRVADCVPVLVGDVGTGRAAAIHAGWRGVVSGVVPATLATMRGRPRDLVAAIGPCIDSCCFEVGEDVARQIEDAVPAPGVVVKRAGGKAWVDLVVAVRAQLLACGVPEESVERVGSCTRCDAERFHSFRRDGAAAGRLFAVIAARDDQHAGAAST